LAKNDFVSRFLDILSGRKGNARGNEGGGKKSFRRVADPLGNFEIDIPEGWSFDQDIAVESGAYSISFESPDGRNRFVVCVNTWPPPKERLGEYARKECEGPESGIICSMEKTRYKGCEAYGRTIRIGKGDDAVIRTDLIFLAKKAAYWISTDIRSRDMRKMAPLRRHMLGSFIAKR